MEGMLFMKGFRISGHKPHLCGEASGVFGVDVTTSRPIFSRGMCVGGRGIGWVHKSEPLLFRLGRITTTNNRITVLVGRPAPP